MRSSWQRIKLAQRRQIDAIQLSVLAAAVAAADLQGSRSNVDDKMILKVIFLVEQMRAHWLMRYRCVCRSGLGEQIDNIHIESCCKTFHAVYRDVPFATFDGPYIGPVQFGFLGQFLL